MSVERYVSANSATSITTAKKKVDQKNAKKLQNSALGDVPENFAYFINTFFTWSMNI